MAGIELTTQDRLRRLEDLVFEMPSLLNRRLESMLPRLTNIEERLASLEKSLGLLQVDMRDLRNGVMAQLRLWTDYLKASDDKIATVDQRLERVEAVLVEHGSKFAAIDARFDGIDARLNKHDRRFDAIDARLNEHDRRFDAIDARLNEHDRRFDAIDARLDDHGRQLKEISGLLTRIADRLDRDGR